LELPDHGGFRPQPPGTSPNRFVTDEYGTGLAYTYCALHIFAIAMNHTVADTCGGFFIHSGLAADCYTSTDNPLNDDWVKGYVAAAMAIEEAKSYITEPHLETRWDDPPWYSSLGITLAPGGWKVVGPTDDNKREYRVSLRVVVDTYYEGCSEIIEGELYEYRLGVLDLELEGENSGAVKFWIWRDQSGISTGGWDASLVESLMNGIYWFALGQGTSVIPGKPGVAAGIIVGLISMLEYLPPIPDYD